MQKQQHWPFGPTKDYPFAFIYNPKLNLQSEDFLNPFLGYPNCPLIGRYNQGQYKIGQTKCHFQFQCFYHPKQGVYKCGQTSIFMPQKIVYNLQNIPQIIKHNKPPNQGKNTKIQDVHPIKFSVLKEVKFIWIITFGQIGKDFLNYLNHMYTLAQDLFVQQKLRRSVFMLPIYAHLPYKSGFVNQQVDKGLCLENYRSQFLSLHLKWGSPAFSPNNMRLGLEGMKKVVSNPPGKRQQKKNIKQKQQQKTLDKFVQKNDLNKQNNETQKQKQEQINDISADLFDDEEENQQKNKLNQSEKEHNKQNSYKKYEQKKTPENNQHKGFVHFYTSVLLENDYRVYYHWHIDNKHRRQLVQAALSSSASIIQFLHKCKDLLGLEDECVSQAFKIFGIKE